MSLSQKNLSSIQKAGQAAHHASKVIATTIQSQAQNLVANVASHPFGLESEQAISRFQKLARLSQGLVSVEAQLRELFAVAQELADPASDVVIALPYAAKHESSNATAVDAVIKPPKVAKKKTKAKRTVKSPTKSKALTANDTALLNFLQNTLKVDDWTRLTGGDMAAGSGLPLGSVGVSLKKLLVSGAVKVGTRGFYQLITT